MSSTESRSFSLEWYILWVSELGTDWIVCALFCGGWHGYKDWVQCVARSEVTNNIATDCEFDDCWHTWRVEIKMKFKGTKGVKTGNVIKDSILKLFYYYSQFFAKLSLKNLITKA